MAKKGFDLAALARQAMGDVSDSDTGAAIVLIPFGEIVPDPDNGYSMDGIEELAGNIETVGLLDPLTVLPRTEAGYPLLSGHRRREAIGRIIEGGSDMFAAGVPCIVRGRRTAADANPRVTELLDRLTLLMANSDNRKMTSADQNHEAERMEAIVAELAELGFEFPGRRRDWVAELSGMSRTKLARLKVIREKLERHIREVYYDKGELSEDAAYELARLPAEHQLTVADWYCKRDKAPALWYAHTIKEYGADLARLEEYTCPEKLGGGACENRGGIMDKIWTNGYHSHGYCAYRKRCCADCPDMASCRSVCAKMQPKADKLRKQNREAQKQAREAAAREDAPKIERIRNIWLRFGNALSRANMEDDELRERVDGTRLWGVGADEILNLECGEASKITHSTFLPFSRSLYLEDAERLIGIADALGCSLDYLFCRTDVPEAGGVSDSDTLAGRLVWHETAIEGPPPDGTQSVICWGRAGLYKPVPHLLQEELEFSEGCCAWWAVVEPPDMSGVIED